MTDAYKSFCMGSNKLQLNQSTVSGVTCSARIVDVLVDLVYSIAVASMAPAKLVQREHEVPMTHFNKPSQGCSGQQRRISEASCERRSRSRWGKTRRKSCTSTSRIRGAL